MQLFLIYTRKLRLESLSGGDSAAGDTSALGFLKSNDGVVHVALTVKPSVPAENPVSSIGTRRRAVKSKVKASPELVVEVEVHQALDALRHRKGDTGASLALELLLMSQEVMPVARAGSVLWRSRCVCPFGLDVARRAVCVPACGAP